MAPLRILISNDDGIFADGIKALAFAAAARGHQVAVVCPDKERSATGHGITIQQPLRAERADQLFGQGISAWACSGTPADCVKLAICELLETPPDLVLSGINHGPNLGTDVFCSGTVAAAMEGTLESRPAMAVSSACFKWREFEGAAVVAMDTAESALREGWPANLLLNLNLPPCKPEVMGPMRWTRLSVRRYREQFSPRTDPQGRTYYWLAGKVVEDLKSGGDGPLDWPTDVAQIGTNSPSLTPIQPELFWRGSLSGLPQVELDGQRVR